MATKQLKNFVQHKLTVNLLAGDLVATWDSVAGWPTVGDFIIRLDDIGLTKTEYALCTAVNVGALQTTIVRGQEGTSGTAFSINDTGGNDLTAQMMADAFVRLDTALSQSLTGPLVIPTALGGSPAATSYGSMPLKAAETLLGAPAASVSWTSIPATFRHMRADWYARGTTVATSTPLVARVNNDVGNNYDYQSLTASTGTVAGASTNTQSSGRVGTMPAASATAAYFGEGDVRIKHYAGTTGNKVLRGDVAMDTGNGSGTGSVEAWMAKWRTTATAINRLDLIPSAGNFDTGSLFTLWLEP